MTILSVVADVCKVVGLTAPSAVFSSTQREHVELAALANEMAERIAQSHEWQLFNTVATYTGDGSNEDFSLPEDFDRMLTKAQVWSSSLETPLSPISDRDRWLGLEVQSFDFVVNAWIIYGGLLHIKPALATDVTAKHWYQSNLIVTADGGDTKTEFTDDTDTYRLPERLLKLGMIWQWKANKGFAYAEDMATFEDLKEKLIARDKGSRLIRMGGVRMPKGLKTAYPQSIVG